MGNHLQGKVDSHTIEKAFRTLRPMYVLVQTRLAWNLATRHIKNMIVTATKSAELYVKSSHVDYESAKKYSGRIQALMCILEIINLLNVSSC